LNEVKTKLENNLKGYEAQIEKLSSDIETARTELEQSSSFNFSRNSKLKGIIESSEVEKNKRKQLVLDCRQRIELIDKITEPIKDGIVQFETKLRNIVDKFEFVI
jgi:chromosome segregation ATPase